MTTITNINVDYQPLHFPHVFTIVRQLWEGEIEMIILILLSFVAVSISLDWFLNYSSSRGKIQTVHKKKVELSAEGDLNPKTA